MPSEQHWARAYLLQAQADLAGLRAMGREAPSVAAMLLQMVFEKFAKAALLNIGIRPLDKARSSHKAASILLKYITHSGLWEQLGLRPGHVQRELVRAVVELEMAHPHLAQALDSSPAGQAPQLEYPWQFGNEVRYPARNLPIARRLGDPQDHLWTVLLRFATSLDREFERLFE